MQFDLEIVPCVLKRVLVCIKKTFFCAGDPMVRRSVSRSAQVSLSRGIERRRNTRSKRRTPSVPRNGKGKDCVARRLERLTTRPREISLGLLTVCYFSFLIGFSWRSQGTYDYGCQLLNAALALRQSCKLTETRNSVLANSLWQSWKQLDDISQEQLTRLRVSTVYHRNVDKVNTAFHFVTIDILNVNNNI